MNPPPFILRVAVPSPLWQSFDYLPLNAEIQSLQPGMRLKVPFGRRETVGILLDVVTHSTLPLSKLKPIIEIIDEVALIPASLLKLYCWASDYYHYPLGKLFLDLCRVYFGKGKQLSVKK